MVSCPLAGGFTGIGQPNVRGISHLSSEVTDIVLPRRINVLSPKQTRDKCFIPCSYSVDLEKRKHNSKPTSRPYYQNITITKHVLLTSSFFLNKESSAYKHYIWNGFRYLNYQIWSSYYHIWYKNTI